MAAGSLPFLRLMFANLLPPWSGVANVEAIRWTKKSWWSSRWLQAFLETGCFWKELLGMRAKSRSISSQNDGMRWLWVFSKYCNEILEDIIETVETNNFPIFNQNLDHPSSEYICFHLILRAAGTRLHQKQESSVCLGRDYWWHGIVTLSASLVLLKVKKHTRSNIEWRIVQFNTFKPYACTQTKTMHDRCPNFGGLKPINSLGGPAKYDRKNWSVPSFLSYSNWLFSCCSRMISFAFFQPRPA